MRETWRKILYGIEKIEFFRQTKQNLKKLLNFVKILWKRNEKNS